MNDLAKLQKALIEAKRREAELAAVVQKSQATKFAALPKSVGLSTVDELIKALVPFSSPKMKSRFAAGKNSKPVAVSKKAVKPASPRRKKRAEITDKTREQVTTLVKAGKTGAEIAKELGISLPSVQNIKAAAGLVSKRA